MGPRPSHPMNRSVAGGPRYLGPIAHPAIGVRIPEILRTGILRALKRSRVAGGMELSFGRETAPQRVIDLPPGVFDITQGHAGLRPEDLSIAEEVKETEDWIPGEIYVVGPIGTETVVDVKVGEELIKLKEKPAFRAKMGEKTRMVFDENNMHLFEKKTEKAIL